METEQNIALLIDCDNASHRSVEGVLAELAKYGVTNIRRAYGNWKLPNMAGWEARLHEFAIQPVQQFAYTSGKNATDAAVIIDAMDLLYTRRLGAVALMTSDSDFTPLVARLLADGVKVYGFGERKTPAPFVNACSRFIFTENLEGDATKDEPSDEAGRPLRKSRNELRGDTALVRLLRLAVDQSADEDGWAHLGRVGQYISNNASFSPVNYGYRKLSELIRASELFQIEIRGDNKSLYVRDTRHSDGS